MTRRRVLLLGSVAVLVSLLGAVLLTWPRPSAITADSIAKIQLEMSRAEVEAILGGPPRDESDGLCRPAYPSISGLALYTDDTYSAEYVGQDCAIRITFYRDRVVRLLFGDMMRTNATLLEKLRGWLGPPASVAVAVALAAASVRVTTAWPDWRWSR
jgi:hypothetical protein